MNEKCEGVDLREGEMVASTSVSASVSVHFVMKSVILSAISCFYEA